MPIAPADEGGASLVAWMEQRRAELDAMRGERVRHDAAIGKAEAELSEAQLDLAKASAAATQALGRQQRVGQRRPVRPERHAANGREQKDRQTTASGIGSATASGGSRQPLGGTTLRIISVEHNPGPTIRLQATGCRLPACTASHPESPETFVPAR